MIISVASGKGGTGKTLVATSLAASIGDRERVQFLDCDVEEPNAHIFLKPEITSSEPVNIPVPEIDLEKCTRCGRCAEICAFNAIAVIGRHVLVFENLCHGCGACSYLCPENAITEKGREAGVIESGRAKKIDFVQGRLTVGEAMVPPVIRQVKEKAGHDGTVIIDVPPGTSCPVVEAVKDSDFCLLVTEPTPFGLNDLELAVETLKILEIPCGVVINRAGADAREVAGFCLKQGLPVLLTIPLDREIARLYSNGVTLAEGMPRWQPSYVKLYERIREILNERTGCTQR
jgi:MinD superfamily P-loop ATPase